MVADDLDAYLEEFGEEVILPGPRQVIGIFTPKKAFVRAGRNEPDLEVNGVIGQPVLWLKQADLNGLKEADTVQVRGSSYACAEPVPDGLGGVDITLTPAPAGNGPMTWN